VENTPRSEPTPAAKRYYARFDPNMTDEELEVWPEHFVEAVLGNPFAHQDDPE
jgi:hypothetical protein